jgi:RNA polymerase sigma-70 factor (ECF subfamily)
MNVQRATSFADRQRSKTFAASKTSPTDERSLVAQAKSGHSSAFGELYERHRLTIYRSVLRILRNAHDAEDALQQSFHRAFINLNRFREDSAFSTWVTRIAINEALMMLRRRHLVAATFQSTDDDGNIKTPIEQADDRPTPEQAFAKQENCAIVADAISRLGKNLRAVALLREMHGLSNAETARRLGLTVTAVKTRTFRARCDLRKHIERRYAIGRLGSLRRLQHRKEALPA